VARANARSISAEMHSGFRPLRDKLSMDLLARIGGVEISEPAVRDDVNRIETMWTEARREFGTGGAYLFGSFSVADAMYAPVVQRFETYAIDVSAPVKAYMQAMIALPAWAEWRRAALAEPWVIPKFEYDWPEVRRLPAAAA
jgi:glutathione S-transferase